MADPKERSFAARWAGGFVDEKPFVSLQIADAKTGADGESLAEPDGEVKELFFTDPQKFMDFIVKGLEAAHEMFPQVQLERVRRATRPRSH